MTTAHSESATERVPGRAWTIRLTGHRDRTATVTCSTTACRMPPRSKDIAALRTFAARHAAAHAKAATLRPNASCHCRAQNCSSHPEHRVRCAGAVVMILRHDPAVRRVWNLEEVCEVCAPLPQNVTVLARADKPPRHRDGGQLATRVPAPARQNVPGGFSSSSFPAASEGGPAPARGSRHGGR